MIGQASRETELRPAEQSLGDNGWQYAERPLPSASGVRKETPQRLGGEPFIAMMQAADLWESDDLARIRRKPLPFDWALSARIALTSAGGGEALARQLLNELIDGAEARAKTS